MAAVAQESRRAFLSRAAGQPRADWLLAETRSGRVMDARWPARGAAIAWGSVWKPFLVCAWGSRQPVFPVLVCNGEWCAPRLAHGALDVERALAESCNEYFVRLAQDLREADLLSVCAGLGLRPPPDMDPRTLCGLRSGWRTDPDRLARAFSLLAARREDWPASVVWRGMRDAASRGTASACGAGFAAKTGTVRRPGASGKTDGLVVLLRAESPGQVLVVRVSGATGSAAAGHARRIWERTRWLG